MKNTTDFFFPFSDEIKEIERTNTSNQGTNICFIWEKNSLRVIRVSADHFDSKP